MKSEPLKVDGKTPALDLGQQLVFCTPRQFN
jgi:hypothetical protein